MPPPQPQKSPPTLCLRREAQADASTEPLLSSFLYASILSHDTFERSLAFVLANRLSDATLLSTELFEVSPQGGPPPCCSPHLLQLHEESAGVG